MGVQEGDVVELQPRVGEECKKKKKKKITVPKGHVWVEGDNAACSVDSRHFGAVPVALLIGRPCWIVRSAAVGERCRAIVDALTHECAALFLQF